MMLYVDTAWPRNAAELPVLLQPFFSSSEHQRLDRLHAGGWTRRHRSINLCRLAAVAAEHLVSLDPSLVPEAAARLRLLLMLAALWCDVGCVATSDELDRVIVQHGGPSRDLRSIYLLRVVNQRERCLEAADLRDVEGMLGLDCPGFDIWQFIFQLRVRESGSLCLERRLRSVITRSWSLRGWPRVSQEGLVNAGLLLSWAPISNWFRADQAWLLLTDTLFRRAQHVSHTSAPSVV
jgi:hypothetical protein